MCLLLAIFPTFQLPKHVESLLASPNAQSSDEQMEALTALLSLATKTTEPVAVDAIEALLKGVLAECHVANHIALILALF